MITGDNIFTAINIGYDSGILESDQDLYICTVKNNKLKWTFQSWEERLQKEEIDEDQFQSLISSTNKIKKSQENINL